MPHLRSSFTCLAGLLLAVTPGVAQETPVFSPPSTFTELVPSEPPELQFEIFLPSGRPTRPSGKARFGKLGGAPNTFYQTPAEVLPWLEAVPMLRPDRVKRRFIGTSSEGQPIYGVEVTPPGISPWKLKRLAILCRQHGDEPEATVSGTRFLREWLETTDPARRKWTSRTALLLIPISNPDGAAVYRRRNSWNIDLNRDWNQRRSPEVKALWTAIRAFKPHLVVDVHQWLPRDHMPPPMAEASGGWKARKTAQAMSIANAQKGYYLAARSRWGADTLCHRFFGQRAGTPAILLESRHRPNVPGARDVAIQQTLAALWSATAVIGK